MIVTDIHSSSDVGPTWSLCLVAFTSLSMLAVAALATFRARRRRRLAAAAAAMLEPGHELRAGGLREGEILLSGVVEHADDHDVAVRVNVTQHGDETCSSGTWSYTWTEIDRAIVVKPFYLALADGTRVRVLAPPNVEVADELDHKVLIARDHRVLSAELIPGETLHAGGTLERGDRAKPGGETGYRDTEYEWQLVPTRGRMLLSSEPLGRGILERMAFHRRYARYAMFLFVVLQLMFINFYVRSFASDRTVMVFANQRSAHRDDEGRISYSYELALLIDGKITEFSVYSKDWDRVERGTEIVVHRGIFGWEIGNAATLYFPNAAGTLLLTLSFLIVYRRRRRQTRPWFRRKVRHTGTGQLPSD